jgi:hypothetical protein
MVQAGEVLSMIAFAPTRGSKTQFATERSESEILAPERRLLVSSAAGGPIRLRPREHSEAWNRVDRPAGPSVLD